MSTAQILLGPAAAPSRTSAMRCPALLPAALGVAVFVAVLWPAGVLNDADTLWHIRVGEWILAHRAVPTADTFSYTFVGRPWRAHEWLAEVLLALAYRAGGWSGLMGLTAAAAGLAAGLLAGCLRRFLNLPLTLLLCAFASLTIVPGLLARPHILALPCLVGWCAALVRARAARAAPSPRLLALMTLWANLHGGFIVGLVLAFALGAEAAIEAGPRWRGPALRWGCFLLGAVAAAVITPYGLEGLIFPFVLVRMKTLSHIQEWNPSDLTDLSPIAAAILLALYFGLTGQLRLPRFRALLLIGLVFATFQHNRHAQLLGTLGPMLAATSLGEHADNRASPVWALPVLALVALIAVGIRLAFPFQRPDGNGYPMTALGHVPEALRSQPVLNGYPFGGILIFYGIRPFIDGRAELYGDAFLTTYIDLIHPKPDVLDGVLARYRIAWTILEPENPAAALMDREPGWHRLYADKLAVIHVRDSVAP